MATWQVKLRFNGQDFDLARRPSGLPCTQWQLVYLIEPRDRPGTTERIVQASPGELTLGVALDLMLPRIQAATDYQVVSAIWIAPDDEIEPQPIRFRDNRDDDASAQGAVVIAPL